MPRPDIDATAALAEECANSRFVTIRQIAAHMNDLLAYVAELEGDRDTALTEQVNKLTAQVEQLSATVNMRNGQLNRSRQFVSERDEQIARVRSLATELREHAAKLDRDPVEHGISAAERFEAHVSEGIANLFIKALDGEPAESGASDG